jgi:hypothetical protein
MNNKELVKKLNTETLSISKKHFSVSGIRYEIDGVYDGYIVILVFRPKKHHITVEQLSKDIRESMNNFLPANLVNITMFFHFIDLEKWNVSENKNIENREKEDYLVCTILISDDGRIIKQYCNSRSVSEMSELDYFKDVS